MEMIRTNIYLSNQQLDRLNIQSKDTGLSKAELVRRAIDKYLKHENLVMKINSECIEAVICFCRDYNSIQI